MESGSEQELEHKPTGTGFGEGPKGPRHESMANIPQSNMQKDTFEVGSVKIDVNYKSLFPKSLQSLESDQNTESDSSELIIVFPGWSMDAHTKSAERIGQAFADAGNKQVLVIDTKPNRVVDDSLYKEAKAVRNLLEKIGTKRITIAGYSEGGIKTIDLAVILQNNPDITIDGVVLMDSVGIYNQESQVNFVGGFVKDALVDTPIALGRRVFQKKDVQSVTTGLKAGTDVLFGLLETIAREKIVGYPKKVMSQIDEMFGKSNHLAELRTPVVLVQGVNDPVSNPEKVVPGYKELDKTEGTTDNEGVYHTQREQYLRTNIFPNSDYVRMVVGKRIVPHHVMPVEDADRVANTSLYLLKRAERQKE